MSASETLPAAAAPAAASIVAVENLRKVYSGAGRDVLALDGATFELPAGSFTAIMGASGSGKSTLLHLIGGLTPPTSGRVLIEGVDFGRLSDHKRTVFRRRRIGVIFQEYNLLPTLSAWENVALPRLLDARPVKEWRDQVDALLATVHLQQRAHHRPQALSGGEQQRVAIARSLLNDPAILLADEPTGNLDSRQSDQIWQLLRRIATEQGRTILMVTHEAQGAAYADRVLILKDGRIIGTLEPKGSADAALVAAGYQKLAG